MSTLMEQTSEKETKQLHNNHNDEEIEIDLMDLLRKVIGIRKKIYKAAGIGLIIGVIVAISIPKQYTVEVTLSPEMGNNKEMIFYRMDNAAGTMQYDRMPNKSGNTNDYRGGSLLGATQEMVDAYFMANGMSPVTGYAADGVTPIINEASGYKEDGTSSSDYKSADGTLYAPAGTRNMYVNREPRFYADITFSNSKWFSGTEGDYTVDFTYSGNCGKAQGNNDFTSTGYLVRKNMDSGDRNQNLVCVLLRLTNIYFDYIEALAYVDPSHADIWKYMNLIRERAGIPVLPVCRKQPLPVKS
jgi:hypothetical protein